jgi:hypothetical protein
VIYYDQGQKIIFKQDTEVLHKSSVLLIRQDNVILERTEDLSYSLWEGAEYPAGTKLLFPKDTILTFEDHSELGCLQAGSIKINSSFITLNVNQKLSISMDEIVIFPAGYHVELLTDTMVTFNQATLLKVTKQILNEKIGKVQ